MKVPNPSVSIHPARKGTSHFYSPQKLYILPVFEISQKWLASMFLQTFLAYLLIPMFLIIFINRCFLKRIFGLFTYFQISLKSPYSQVSMINCEKQSSRESAADNRSPQYMEISQRFSLEQTIWEKKISVS